MYRRIALKLLASVLILTSPILAERVPDRYIVELSTDSVAVNQARQGITRREGWSGAAVNAHRVRIRAEQQAAASRVQAQQGVVLDRTENVANTLFVQISDEQAAALAALPGVLRVVPVRTVHMLLDRAVQVNHISEVWSEVGLDRAGAGVKIAIIDSGVDSTHPALQSSTLVSPDSFPRVNAATDQSLTSNKVIVARSYVSLLPTRDPDLSARDHVGHGTALASIAAGGRATGPLASVAGVAPQAYVGNYKVFGTPGFNDSSTDDAIIKAIDDAVGDGMDIINLSLGSDFAPRLADDLEVAAVERASAAGVIVVAAAGNNGNDLNTISSPATAPSVIAVGAMSNGRTFAASALVEGMNPVVAILSDGTKPATPVPAVLTDVAALDGTGHACNSFAGGSLTGRIALIQRGTCTFESKLTNAQAAGAVAALVYAPVDAPDPISMAVGAATLPAAMVSFDDGSAIRRAVSSNSGLTVTLDFTEHAVELNSNRLANFSAAGPNVDIGIKPDLVAVGTDMYVPTQAYDTNGDMYEATGFVLVDGTSFSTPMVAGAAALLKSARPGLTVAQYRSLIINSASAIDNSPGIAATVQQSGAGALNALASLHQSATVAPTSLSFGQGGSTLQSSQNITITNVSANPDTYLLSVVPRGDDGSAPAVAVQSVDLAPGESKTVAISWQSSSLSAGAHEGVIHAAAVNAGTDLRVPYWYASASVPAHVTVLDAITSARRNTNQTDAILFRITDSAGVINGSVEPQVTVTAGGGAVRRVTSYDSDVPGLYGVAVRLGATAGSNSFRVQAGDAVVNVTITGQ